MAEASKFDNEPRLRGNGLLRQSGSDQGLVWSLRSDRGLVREVNEDFALAKTLHGGDGASGSLLIIADGLGGHEAGEVASRIAVVTMAQAWSQSVDRPIKARLRSAFRLANQAVFDEALRRHNNGMATTLTAAAVVGDIAMVAHVGDSRAYLIRRRQVEQLTNDHSQVAEMLRRGLITPREAISHPARSVLTRCLGRELQTTPDIAERTLHHDDVLLLCSDGLWDLVTPEEMVQAIRNEDGVHGDQMDGIVEELMKLAIYRGAPDNVTVMIARVEEPKAVVTPTSGLSHWFKRG
jgi:protein phosphatase